MEILLLFFVILLLISIGWASYRVGNNKVRISNEEVLKERDIVVSEIKQQKQRTKEIENEYHSKQKLIQDAKSIAEKEYRTEIEKYHLQIEHLQEEFNSKYEASAEEYRIQIESLQKDLNSLKNQKAATIEALQKERAIAEQADLYRLNISKSDMEDISLLQSIQYKLSKPRVLAMLIWQTYYLPIAKKKFPVILGGKEMCGIYKITNIRTEKCYIGQAIDIKTRWYEHCKCGLGIDTPQRNKLYEAMLEDGLYEFTFELLEECSKEELDKKEKYYIELYNSIYFGYNSQSGAKGK